MNTDTDDILELENKEIDVDGYRCKVIKKISEGGCGVTYKVIYEGEPRQKVNLGDKLVLKTINIDSNNSPEKNFDALINDFTNLKGCQHEHIVEVLGFNHIVKIDLEENRQDTILRGLLMYFIEGQNLWDYLGGTQEEIKGEKYNLLSEPEALKYIDQVCEALRYLHHKEKKDGTRSIIHHDVKPQNIMLCDDEKNPGEKKIVLIDFGASRVFLKDRLIINKEFRTPHFSPYELLNEPTTDVYGVAATLYFLLTKKLPESAEERKEGTRLTPPKEYNSKISDRVNDAIMKGMAMEAKDRPQSVMDLWELLKDEDCEPPEPRYQYLLETRYSFETNANGQSQTYFFTLDEEDFPVEIGNGNYGVVYRVHDKKGKKFAFKILYKYDEESLNSMMQLRFEAEINSSDNIQQKLDDLHTKGIPGIVLTIDGTSRFKDSLVYDNFGNTVFVQRLSNYGLVMELYDQTLEELLENKIKKKYAIFSADLTHHRSIEQKVFKSRAKAETHIVETIESSDERSYLIDRIYQLNGYDLLRNLDFRDRTNNILPFLLDIAQGVKLLHQAGYLHLDLKPANIFVRRLGEKFESAIGDLGFLDRDSFTPQSLLGKYDILPLGTLNYRSPEQRFFYDIANVEIQEDRTLIVRDYMFRETIIEPGDYVVFSKYNDRSYEIKSIEIIKGKNAPVIVTLRINKYLLELKSAKKTQAKFYKVQGKRTDLFGIGAIAFNLITCGESPERFYESIRRYDNENSTIEQLIKEYENIATYESDETRLIKIFEPFQDQNSTEYAPIEIVRLILKCMLYKSPDTFYNEWQKEQDIGEIKKEPTGILLDKIIALIQN
jgi:serine/threonine protein kinase